MLSTLAAEGAGTFGVGEDKAHLIGGSNAWIISGKHTESGKPLLSSDPHLGVEQPGVGYLSSIHYPGMNVWGVNVLSIPVYLIGATDHLTFGVTTLFTDTADIYEEKIQGEKYLFEGKWLDLKKRTEKILISGAEPHIFTIYETHHGPLIGDSREFGVAIFLTPMIALDRNYSFSLMAHRA